MPSEEVRDGNAHGSNGEVANLKWTMVGLLGMTYLGQTPAYWFALIFNYCAWHALFVSCDSLHLLFLLSGFPFLDPLLFSPVWAKLPFVMSTSDEISDPTGLCVLWFSSKSLVYPSNYLLLSRIVINADAPYIKMVSEQFDRCHGVLLQYVDFLCSAVSPLTAYAQLIPTLHDLVHLYHLDPEVRFLFWPCFVHSLLRKFCKWVSD